MLRRPILTLVAAAVFAPAASAQLRIVTWNISDTSAGDFSIGASPDRRTAAATVFSAIGTESVNGIARQLDILLIQESRGAAQTGQTFVDILNGIYGSGSYARGTVNGVTTGNGTHSIVYRTATVSLVGEVALPIISGTTGAAREPLRHQVRPAGFSAANLYLYNAHWKAGSGSSDASRRASEAAATRADADALGNGVRAVYTGDFNLQGPTETGYTNLLAAGNARAIDPVFSGSEWSSNTLANRRLHSQSPVTSPLYTGQATGGMDDRYDFQLPTANMDPATGRGIKLVAASSYRVFGNNGTHTINQPLNSGSQPSGVLTALRQTSEHLPVVVDYTLPARLAASVTGSTQRVIRGQTASVGLSVTNSSPASVAAGADVLDYNYAGTGQVQGSASASGLAVGATANSHTLTVPTTTAGTYTGTVTATATSPQAATTYSPTAVTVTALDPSRGSFDNATHTTVQTVNFGSLVEGNSDSRMLAVYNLVGPTSAALTANLRFISLTETNAGGPISATLNPTSPDLAAGVGNWTLTVQFSGSPPGSYTDTITLNLSDENIPGALAQTLTVNVSGTFTPVPEPGTIAFLLATVAGAGYARRRVRRG